MNACEVNNKELSKNISTKNNMAKLSISSATIHITLLEMSILHQRSMNS
jgi:hypothetical protein